MRGRNSRASTMGGRQYATGVSGTIISFVCTHGHAYRIDFSKKPLHRRLGAQACAMMAGWWSREKGGCIGECPTCVRSTRKKDRV